MFGEKYHKPDYDQFIESCKAYAKSVDEHQKLSSEFEEQFSTPTLARRRFKVTMNVNGMIQCFFTISKSQESALANILTCAPNISALPFKVLSVEISGDVTDEDRKVYNEVQSKGYDFMGVTEGGQYVFINQGTTMSFNAKSYSDALGVVNGC